MGILRSAMEIIAGVFKWRQSPARAKAQHQSTRAEIEREVRSGDVEAMNRRLKKNGVIKAILIPTLTVLLIQGCACRPSVVYINESERVDKITVNGTTFVLVPEGTYTEMVDIIDNCTCHYGGL